LILSLGVWAIPLSGNLPTNEETLGAEARPLQRRVKEGQKGGREFAGPAKGKQESAKMTKRDTQLDNFANSLAAVSTSILAIATVWLFIAYREELKDLGKICNLAGKGRIEKR
jgi:hypothetical protein